MTTSGKVLIVDDEQHVRDYVSLLVKSALSPAEVLSAGNREEAVAIYQQTQPDLVLLDIMLVGESGFDVLRDLRAINPAVKVVILSTLNIIKYVEQAKEEGAKGYLLKDMSAEELYQALQNMVKSLFPPDEVA